MKFIARLRLKFQNRRSASKAYRQNKKDEKQWLELLRHLPKVPDFYSSTKLQEELRRVLPVVRADRDRLQKALIDASGTVPVYCDNALYHARWKFMAPGDVRVWLDEFETILITIETLLGRLVHPDVAVSQPLPQTVA